MSNKFKKILLIAVTSLEIFSLTAYNALAFDIPSPNEVMSDVEQRYHLDQTSLQSFGENSNVAEEKKVAPQVMVSFSPTDPGLGEKVTATAFPVYFQNPKESLYYTWYLKHPECKKSKKGDSDYLKKCDLNDDGKVNVDDWKIEAMRIIATNGFDWNTALGLDSSNCTGGSNDPDYCSLDNKYNSGSDDPDKDGYTAHPGGDDRPSMSELDKNNMKPHCYIHDFNSGVDYELVKSLPGSTGLSCADLGDGITRVPACVQSNDSVVTDKSGNTFSSTCTNTTDTPSCQGSIATCPSGETAECVDNTIINNDPVAPVGCSDVEVGADNPFSPVTCNANGSNDISFICDSSDRRHLFPYPKDGSPSDTGDGSFNNNEEKFWRTNPADSDTAKNGNKDEANITGLGVDKFSWNYEPGDKVGVVVEGTSVNATKYADSSMMIEWALPKNKCDIKSHNDTAYAPTIKGYSVKIPITAITDDSNGQDSCIDNNCLNNCLSDNLLDPRENGTSSTLDVSLSYNPQSPNNDSSGANEGDELAVNAAALGVKDSAYLKYTWQVYSGDSVNPDTWTPILKSQLPDVGQTSGIGLDTLKFKLNFPDPAPKFLKVTVTASENMDDGGSGVVNQGNSEVVIPISSSANKIHVYPVSASPNMVLSLGQDERCNTGMDSALCPVVQNEIIGMKVDGTNFTNFVWTVNGEPIQPINYQSGSQCASGECDPNTGAATNIAFFPVLDDKGTQYSVTMSANNAKGEKVTITKNFEVVDPEIKILSLDTTTCRPVLLGSYLDLNNQSWPDYSETSFQATPGTTISLQPALNNPFAQDLLWYIDGVAMTPENLTAFGASVADDGTLTFPAQKQLGEIYNVAVEALYTQDDNTKKFLNLNEGVQLSDFAESTISDNIEIQMIDLSGPAGAQANTPRKFLAALFTGLPAYISFLFRIVLTVMLILAVSWITLAFTPRTREE